MEMISQFKEETEIKNKLLNCLLINRHYILVLEKKTLDFIDYTESKKTMEEKEDICRKFVITRT